MAGKYKYYEEQLVRMRCNILMVQEHKGAAHFCCSRNFMRLHAEGQRHWGVGIWISRRFSALFLNGHPTKIEEADILVRFESERLLVLELNIGGNMLLLVSAHCPHAAKQQEAAGFLRQFEHHLKPLKASHLTLVGIDLNGRFPADHDTVSGDLMEGHEGRPASH